MEVKKQQENEKNKTQQKELKNKKPVKKNSKALNFNMSYTVTKSVLTF